MKCEQVQEFVIGGHTDPQGTRTGFGALLLGRYEGDALVYAGKVGTGFDEQTLRQMTTQLRALEQADSPFQRGDPPRRGTHWVEPEVVAHVAFVEWTNEGLLRHPRFLGLREVTRSR